MRPSPAHQALCALLAVALVALPGVAIAARIVPGVDVDLLQQRSLLDNNILASSTSSGSSGCIGHLPVISDPIHNPSVPAGVKIGADVSVGAVVAIIPIYADVELGVRLGGAIPLKGGPLSNLVNSVVGSLTQVVSGVLGSLLGSLGVGVDLSASVELDVAAELDIILGEPVPCYGSGTPTSSIKLPRSLGVAIGAEVELAVEAAVLVKATTSLVVDVEAGLFAGACAGVLPLCDRSVPAVASPLTIALGLDIGVIAGAVSGCVPIVKQAPTGIVSGLLDLNVDLNVDVQLGVVVGKLLPWGSSAPHPVSVGGIAVGAAAEVDLFITAWIPVYKFAKGCKPASLVGVDLTAHLCGYAPVYSQKALR